MQRIPDLDDALQDLSEVVGSRLVLLDETMRVVGYSIHESDADRRRLSHLLTHSDTWPAPRTTTRAYAVETRKGVGRCLFVRLTERNHRIVGHLLLVLDKDPVSEQVCDRLLADAPALGDLLALRRARGERDRQRAAALTVDLITGDPDRRTAAAEALLSERILSDSGRYCAVAVGVDPRAPVRDAEKAALAVTLTTAFVETTSTATVVGAALPDGLGALVFPRPVVAHRLTRILERPEVRGVRAGLGPLVGIEDVHRSFDRARLAWRAGCFAPDEHPTVLDWDQAGLDATLARLPLEHLDVADLPPAVRRLIEHDLGRDLLVTLDRYLARGGDARAAAHALSIHRSTLYYRLDKVRDVLGADLRDGTLRRELHTGIRLAQLAGLGPWAR